MKICVGCKKKLPLKDFFKSVRSDDGRNRYCKICCKVNRALEAVRKRDKRVKISARQIDRAVRAGIRCEVSITLALVYKRARGHCHLCNKWVQPRHASIDHVLPISKGGHHTWDNVDLTHLKCNLRKGNRV